MSEVPVRADLSAAGVSVVTAVGLALLFACGVVIFGLIWWWGEEVEPDARLPLPPRNRRG